METWKVEPQIRQDEQLYFQKPGYTLTEETLTLLEHTQHDAYVPCLSSDPPHTHPMGFVYLVSSSLLGSQRTWNTS